MKNKRIIYLGNMLSKHGFTPTTIETLSKRLAKKYEVHSASDKRLMLFRLLDMWYTLLINRKGRLAIIDTYSSKAFHFAWTSAILCKWLRIPYVVYIHGGRFAERVAASPARVGKYLNEASCIVAPSRFLLNTVSSLRTDKTFVIPNTVELSYYKFKDKADSGPIKILWLRSLQKIYRPVLAVQILRRIHEFGYTDAEMWLIGPDKDGSLAEINKLIHQLGMEEKVHLPGKLAREQWLAIAEQCNLFLNSTSADNTPVSVIEAMAIGLPVVSSRVGGMQFLINSGTDGFLLDSDDPEDYARQLIELHHNKDLFRTIASAARKKVECYDWQEVEKKWEQLIDGY